MRHSLHVFFEKIMFLLYFIKIAIRILLSPLIGTVKHHEAGTINIKITVEHTKAALVQQRPHRITAHLRL